METWKGNIQLNDGNEIADVRLDGPSAKLALPRDCSLEFLSHVDTTQIPLHLICGPRLDVWTTSPETEAWFSRSFLEAEWWHTASIESPLGMLVAVKSLHPISTPQPRITEILFYALRNDNPPNSPPTPPHSSQHGETTPLPPSLQLCALPLSSDLFLATNNTTTPPLSPTLPLDTPHGRFLSFPWDEPTTTQKRKAALETTFLAADEQRRKLKRHLGASVAAAAAGSSVPAIPIPRLKSEPSNNVQRDVSRPPVPLLTRPKTRSPSIASLAKHGTEQRRTSGLARVSTPGPEKEETETVKRNKDAISKVVLAGMRVWGFSQSKRRKSIRPPTANESQDTIPSFSTSFAVPESQTEAQEADRANDEEYKLVYHNVYKAAVFAFRGSIGDADLGGQYADKVRDTVDTLLGIFCKDPLVDGFGGHEGNDMIKGPKGAVVRTPGREEDKRLELKA